MTPDNSDVTAKIKQQAEELSGVLSRQDEEDKLMKSVLENDKKTIDDGTLVNDAINRGLGMFTPDLMMEQLVHDYASAKKIYGPKILRFLTSYDANYIEKNIRIPEFQREMRNSISKKIEALKDSGVLAGDGSLTDKAITLAALILYSQELDRIIPKGIGGEKEHKKKFMYGSKADFRNFKSQDRYRDISIKKSVKLALRRRHEKIEINDLQVFEREEKGRIYVMYGLDASGSMKGKKIETAKKAGIALAFKAIENKDRVGLIVFGSDIKDRVEPTLDFMKLLRQITRVNATKETDIAKSIAASIEMFPRGVSTKHLILLTDALPTVGKEPEEKTLEAVGVARNEGITISVIGIGLDEQGRKLAEKIAILGEGRLFVVKNLANLDMIVLEDYYAMM